MVNGAGGNLQNPRDSYGQMGDAALWTGFAFTFFATIVFLGVSMLNDKPKSTLLHNLSVSIVLVSALAYLIEALGNTEIETQAGSGWVPRSLLWLRYAQWVVNTPMLIAVVGLLAGTTVTELAYTTLLAIVTTGALFAAAVTSGFNATWPIYAFGVIAALPIIYTVLVTWAARAASTPKNTKAVFTVLSWAGFFLSIGYAVNWGTAEGGKVQTQDQEVITYTVLDILSRVVLGFILVMVPGAIDGAAGFLSEASIKVEEASAAAPASV